MDLAHARYVWHDGYPMLEVEVDGRLARLDAYPKPGVHLAGYVSLGSRFRDLLPPITLHPPDGGPTVLTGCSDDRRLWLLYDRFLHRADPLAEGPVPIPDAGAPPHRS